MLLGSDDDKAISATAVLCILTPRYYMSFQHSNLLNKITIIFLLSSPFPLSFMTVYFLLLLCGILLFFLHNFPPHTHTNYFSLALISSFHFTFSLLPLFSFVTSISILSFFLTFCHSFMISIFTKLPSFLYCTSKTAKRSILFLSVGSKNI